MRGAYQISLGQGSKFICFTDKKHSFRVVDAMVLMNAK